MLLPFGRGGLLCDAKIGEISVVIFIEEDVFRLDIVVNDAISMGKFQCRSNVIENGEGFIQRQAALPHPVPKASAAQIAHDEVRPIRVSPIIEKRNDVRMLHARNQVRFILESLNELPRVGMNRQN